MSGWRPDARPIALTGVGQARLRHGQDGVQDQGGVQATVQATVQDTVQDTVQAMVHDRVRHDGAPPAADPAEAGAHWPWLKLDVDPRPLAGRWVRLRYRSGLLEPLVRPVLRCVGAPAPTDRVLPAALFGRGVWLGRIPRATRELWISPTNRAGPFAFAVDAIELPGAVALGTALLRRSPRHWLTWILTTVAGLHRERDVQIRRQLSPTPLAGYDAWRRARTRAFEPAGFDGRPPPAGGPCHLRLIVAAEPGPGPASGRESRLAGLQRFLREQPHRPCSIAVVGGSGADAATPDTPVLPAAPDASLLHVAPDAPWTACAAGLAAGDLLVPFALGDTMPDYALAAFAAAAAEAPAAAGLCADADRRDRRGRFGRPVLRPGHPTLPGLVPPDPTPALALRVGTIGGLGAGLTAADLLRLPAGLLAGLPLHPIRRVLRTLGPLGPLGSAADPAPPAAVRAGLARPAERPPAAAGAAAAATAAATVVIPTRDRLDLLVRCIDSIRPALAAAQAAVVVVDNGSVEPATRAFLAALATEPRFTVVSDDGPFNFSRLCNAGAARARTPRLVFLNNDIEALDAAWLERMIRWADLPGVGAVGAKLLYPDRRRVQHAGVVLGIDNLAGHFERGCAPEAAGFFGNGTLAHAVSAVTAACLAVATRKFEAVGGFDAAGLPVDLNDIDLCLRLAARGWCCLVEPGAVLVHQESASRGITRRPDLRYGAEQAVFRARWADAIRDDPFFHPALSVDAFDARLG